MKCVACGEEIVVDENGHIQGGEVSINFYFKSENDMETWNAGIHDSCAKSIRKLVEIKERHF